MASDEKIPNTYSSPSDGWKDRILIPTLVAGAIGGGFGLLSKHRRLLGVGRTCAAYATNFSIVTGCYCGAREFVRASRDSEPGDLIDSAVGGFASGALLGRLQGGQFGAIKYSMMFAMAGTTADFAIPRLYHLLQTKKESLFGNNENSEKKSGDWLKLPEWSPIQVLDEEALAAKRAREQQLYGQTVLGKHP
ncbi:Mitochondrial inner membrane translocase subunit Tim17/Tim22/Tim23/peroxisomal protein PMP24 [Macleaya cordata]|uniref:Mitochondrial inner membrane translocase subunit Tim17/Tim22/Tim23/peroxisomal protein PMP24 n=1 Tax=Macleaya cordata TaxID=56857 RepID=A0A200R383_MACCD|nr:Mitochondrial inner membrane translocase subunit Tim17/Tim22/Tim23/peroxisomal protein PMP24 [Macleaya cordata]